MAKTSRLYLYAGIAGYAASAIGVLYLCMALYRNVEASGTRISNEVRLAPLLSSLQEQVRRARTADDIKKSLRALDSTGNLGASNPYADRVKKIYGNVQAHYSDRGRDADPRMIPLKKKEFLDMAFQTYRREAGGDVALRTLLVSLVNDGQANLLSETAEQDTLYAGRAKEKIEGLKRLSQRSRSSNAEYWSGLADAHARLEAALEANQSWNNQRNELLAAAEKQLAQLQEEIKKQSENGLESAQQGFIGAVFFAFITLALGGICLMAGYVWARRRQIRSLAGLAREVEGSESTDTLPDPELHGIAQRWRESRSKHHLRDSRRSIFEEKMPAAMVLVSATDEIVHLNSIARERWNGEAQSVSDLFTSGRVREWKRVLQQFPCTESRRMIVHVREGDGWEPADLFLQPVSDGAYAGGCLVVCLPRAGERERLRSMTKIQLDMVAASLDNPEVTLNDEVLPETAEITKKIAQILRERQERELRWQAEVRALRDQSSRESELLERHSQAIAGITEIGEELKERLAGISGTGRKHLEDLPRLQQAASSAQELCRRLEAAARNWRVLQESSLRFQRRLRSENSAIQDALELFEQDMSKLRSNADAARLYATNLSLQAPADPALFAQQARHYAHSLQDYLERMDKVIATLRNFVVKSVVQQETVVAEAGPEDESLVATLREVSHGLSSYLERWQGGFLDAKDASERASQLSHELSSRSSEAAHLNETCQQINRQASASLDRWN